MKSILYAFALALMTITCIFILVFQAYAFYFAPCWVAEAAWVITPAPGRCLQSNGSF